MQVIGRNFFLQYYLFTDSLVKPDKNRLNGWILGVNSMDLPSIFVG